MISGQMWPDMAEPKDNMHAACDDRTVCKRGSINQLTTAAETRRVV